MKTNLTVLPNERPTTTIGGTDAGVLLGMHPYKSLAQVFDGLQGVAAPTRDSDLMERGRMLEGVVRELTVQRGGYRVARANIVLADPALPRVHASLDGVMTHPARPSLGVFEAKVMTEQTFTALLSSGIAPHYYAQVQHYLWVTGATWAVFAALEPARWNFHHFQIERDQALIDRLAEAVEVFWRDHMDPRERPGRTRHVQRGEVPTGLGTHGYVTDAPEWMEAMAVYRDAKEMATLAETRLEAAKEQLKALMATANAESAQTPMGRIAWRESTRTTFNREAFQAEHPTVDLNPFYEGRVTRSFHVTVR